MESFELIHQDDFYKRNEKLPVEHSTNWECWDCIESVRIDELISQLDPTKNIILEGFLLFQDQRIQKICDLMFLLHVDLDTMKSRRENRIYPLSGILTLDVS